MLKIPELLFRMYKQMRSLNSYKPVLEYQQFEDILFYLNGTEKPYVTHSTQLRYPNGI